MILKKIFIVILTMFLLTGCVNINDASYIDIITSSINSKEKIYNTYRKGYKFYLPKGMYVTQNNSFNEIIKSKSETYYLYVDVLSYINKRENTYEENTNSFYSKKFSNDGYIEINDVNSKYLVEIVYNYAKIEVMVEKQNLRSSIANSIIVLSSIMYNDTMLLSGEMSVLNYKEENIDIFKAHGKDNSNFLEYVEYDDFDESAIPDYDLIK